MTGRRLSGGPASLAVFGAIVCAMGLLPAAASALPPCSASQPPAYSFTAQDLDSTSLAWDRPMDPGMPDYVALDSQAQQGPDAFTVSFTAADAGKPISYPFAANVQFLGLDVPPNIRFAHGDGAGRVTWTWHESTTGSFGPPACDRSASVVVQPVAGTKPKFKVRLRKRSKLPGYLGSFQFLRACRAEATSATGAMVFKFSFDGLKRTLRKNDQCERQFHGYGVGPGFALEYGGMNVLNLWLGFPKNGIHDTHRGTWKYLFGGKFVGRGHFSFNLD